MLTSDASNRSESSSSEDLIKNKKAKFNVDEEDFEEREARLSSTRKRRLSKKLTYKASAVSNKEIPFVYGQFNNW